MNSEPVSLTDLLVYVEQALQGDRRMLTQLFREFQHLANHPTAPPEERSLGQALMRILMGDRHPDLGDLDPEAAAELAEWLKRLE